MKVASAMAWAGWRQFDEAHSRYWYQPRECLRRSVWLCRAAPAVITPILTAYSSTNQRGKAATPRPLATICTMMSVVSMVLWRLGVTPAGSRNWL